MDIDDVCCIKISYTYEDFSCLNKEDVDQKC